MNSVSLPGSSPSALSLRRSGRGELIAAFLLGGLMALLLATPARAAEPFRLDRMAIVRFAPTSDGRLLMQNGVLHLTGDVAWRGTQTIARPANTPEWVLHRDVVNVIAWLGFHNLGTGATANFEVQEGGTRFPIGDQYYLAVGVSPTAQAATGKLANLSTRTTLSDGQVVIAGFVIEDRPRAVLVRAVGPSLGHFNVTSAHPDPWLAVKRGSQTLVGNDDWMNQAGADRVAAAAARVGAFPLGLGAFDAAVLTILPPGAYTVHVASDLINVRSRDVLIEVYTVPEDAWD